MAIWIGSYLRANGTFVPVADFGGRVTDSDYVEGAIHLVVNDVELLTFDEWDYVDQLWAYLVDCVADALSGEAAQTMFPDQPIKVSARTVQKRKLLVLGVEAGENHRTAAVETRPFLEEFCTEGRRFFEKMSELNPRSVGSYQLALQHLAELERAAGGWR